MYSSGALIRWGVRIPLRDGVELNATVYLPRVQRVPEACVVTLTPYVADTFHDQAMYFATRGCPFAVVDVRGRGNSAGQFRPLIQESADAFDVVEWLASQPYCNGKVAMWGGSYAGYVQWAAAKELPPHLCTLVPVASPFPGTDFPMRSNIFYPYLIRWLTYTSGGTLQSRIFNDDNFWSDLNCEWIRSGDSFRDIDNRLGGSLPIFREWLSHPEPDAYWDSHNPTPEQYKRLELPILTITGCYDDDQLGALEHYRLHISQGEECAHRHFLVIGPWDHEGTRTPRNEVGGINLGPASLVDLPALHLQWYRWVMGTGIRPTFLRKRVAYYVMGTEKWRYADSLSAVTSRLEAFYLDSRGTANRISGRGCLKLLPGSGPPDSYCYDPRDTSGPEIAAEARRDGRSLIDEGLLAALDGRVLVYDGAPMSQDIEISGFFELTAWISIDCPDTDFYVSVYEVSPSRGVIRLTTDAMRARYRHGLRKPRLITTDAPLRYSFRAFTFVSRQVERGHWLRLVIAPVGPFMEATFAERNYNGGGIVSAETRNDGKAVIATLFHDQEYPSVLHVPWGRPEKSRAEMEASRS